MSHPDITVQIMAGGRSSRMGTDKAAVVLAGETLLDRAVKRWAGWGDALFVSVGKPGRARLAPAGTVPVFDRFPDCGPLGGLHGGLAVCTTPLLLLCAVDTPFLTPALAERLAGGIGEADACVFTLDGRPQPLFGLYRVSPCLPAAQALLQSGERRMRALLERVDTASVPTADGRAFQNLNTPGEVAEAEKELLLQN